MMELIVLGLIILFLYAFIRLMTSFSSWMGGARYRAYRQLANRFHGRYESRGISDPPTVSFLYHGTTVRVGLAPTVPGPAGKSAHARRRAISEGDPVPARAGADLPALRLLRRPRERG